MKCLVSGATGFIGRHLCPQLVAQGNSVIALSRSGSSLDDGAPTLALDLAERDPDVDLLQGVDVVFHLAGIAHQRAEGAAYQQLNYLATLRLARLSAAAGVTCFVYLSSVKAMGSSPSGHRRTEDDCNPPRDAYGWSKWQAECALRDEFASADMSIVILRPALVYGAQAKGNLRLLARGVRLGLPRPPQGGARSMIAVGDLVSLMCNVAASPLPGVHTWIACDNRTYSTRLFYDLLRDTSGKGRGLAWLPRWAWWLGAAVLDLARARSDDSTYDKLFGTELYSNAAVLAATDWKPAERLEDVVTTMFGGAGEPL